jgi:hypothetical protein
MVEHGNDNQSWFCLENENILSLKTVLFVDTGVIAWMSFLPEWDARRKESREFGFLYRRKLPYNQLSQLELLSITHREIWPELLDIDASFPPNVTFHWADDGQSVVVLVDRNPVGFLAHDTQIGYTKFLRNGSRFGNVWNEDIYQRLFVRPHRC